MARLLSRLNPFGRPTIATFPGRTVINAATIQEDSLLGSILGRHLDVGNINQEEAIKLWLVVHRAMGPHSPYHPYFQTLPAVMPTPIHYNEAEMSQLAGTPLFHAVQVLHALVVHSMHCL